MDSEDFGDFCIPLLDLLEMPDLDTSSKLKSILMLDGSSFYRRAMAFCASSNVWLAEHSKTYCLFLSMRVNSAKHSVNISSDSSSPTMLQVQMIFWSPYQGLPSRSRVSFGFSQGVSSTSETSSEFSSDSLIWLQILDSSFFYSILLSRTEQKLMFLLLRSMLDCTFMLSAFLIFLSGELFLRMILGMPSLSSEQDYLETE